MIEHKINDQALDSADVSFTLVIRNPFLNLETDGTGTYTFTIPATDKVRKALNFIHRVQSLRQEQDANWKTFSSGRKIIDGTAVYSQADEKDYEMAIGAGKGEFFYKIKDKKLTDLQYEDVVMGTTTGEVMDFLNNAVLRQYPETDVNFPMFNIPEFYGDANELNPLFRGIVNYFDVHSGWNCFKSNSIEIYPNNPDYLKPLNWYNIIPWPYLVGVIKKIFSDNGYTVEGNFLNDPEIKKQIIFNNAALDYKEKHYYSQLNYNNTVLLGPRLDGQSPVRMKFWSIVNIDSFFNNYGFRIFEIGNYIINGFIQITNRYYNDPTYAHYHDSSFQYTGNFYVYLDSDLLETIPFSFYGEFGNIEINKTYPIGLTGIGKLLVISAHSQYPLTQTKAGLEVYNDSECNLNRYSRSYNIKNHLPGKLINDFLNAITIGFGAFFFYDHKQKHCLIRTAKEILSDPEVVDFKSNIISPLITKPEPKKKFKINFDFGNNEDLLTDNFLSFEKYIFKGEVNTWEECSGIIGDYYIVRNLNCIYLNYIENYVAGFREYSDNYYDKIIGDGEEITEVKIGFSPLFMELAESYYQEGIQSCLIPYSKIKGTSLSFGSEKNEFDLRLMIYHGMQENMHHQLYPFASSSNYDFWGNRIGELALNLSSADGLYELFLKQYYEFLLDLVRYESEKMMTIKEFEDLSISKKHNIFQNFFIDYMEIAFDKTDKLHAKLYLARKAS